MIDVRELVAVRVEEKGQGFTAALRLGQDTSIAPWTPPQSSSPCDGRGQPNTNERRVVTGSPGPHFHFTQRTGGGREHRPERTRARLIDAASSAFAERGYAATSVHDICALADLSVGSFYYHFDDKAGITLGILERENERVMRRIESMDPRRASSIEETLNELLHGPGAPLNRALREAAEVERHIAEVEAELRRVTHDGLVAAITRAREASDRYRIEARTIAWTFLAMLRAALVEPVNKELAHGIAEIVHHAVVAREGPNSDPAP